MKDIDELAKTIGCSTVEKKGMHDLINEISIEIDSGD